MGQWNMTIQGHGVHDNGGKENDADVMMAAFLNELRAKGHVVEDAWFTVGMAREV
jgi:hypothetical protein